MKKIGLLFPLLVLLLAGAYLYFTFLKPQTTTPSSKGAAAVDNGTGETAVDTTPAEPASTFTSNLAGFNFRNYSNR